MVNCLEVFPTPFNSINSLLIINLNFTPIHVHPRLNWRKKTLDDPANKYLSSSIEKVGGAAVSWLVRSTPHWAVRVDPRTGTLSCVLGQDTLLSQCLSSLRCLIQCRGVTLRWTSNPSRGEEKYSQLLYATETGDDTSADLMDHFARMQTWPSRKDLKFTEYMSTRETERILKSWANSRGRRGFAQFSRILLTYLVFRWGHL